MSDIALSCFILFMIILWKVICSQKADRNTVDVNGTEDVEVTEGGRMEISMYYVRNIYIQ